MDNVDTGPLRACGTDVKRYGRKRATYDQTDKPSPDLVCGTCMASDFNTMGSTI